MKKIEEYGNCVIATMADGFTYLVAPNAGLQEWMDGVCFEDYRAANTPSIPGVYRATIEVWFEQGYSEGYLADGESDWEFKLTSVEPIAIDNFEPFPVIENVMDRPTLDDVMDWYSLGREKGESLEEWQKKYPYYAEDLAQFEAFLQVAGTYEE